MGRVVVLPHVNASLTAALGVEVGYLAVRAQRAALRVVAVAARGVDVALALQERSVGQELAPRLVIVAVVVDPRATARAVLSGHRDDLPVRRHRHMFAEATGVAGAVPMVLVRITPVARLLVVVEHVYTIIGQGGDVLHVVTVHAEHHHATVTGEVHGTPHLHVPRDGPDRVSVIVDHFVLKHTDVVSVGALVVRGIEGSVREPPPSRAHVVVVHHVNLAVVVVVVTADAHRLSVTGDRALHPVLRGAIGVQTYIVRAVLCMGAVRVEPSPRVGLRVVLPHEAAPLAGVFMAAHDDAVSVGGDVALVTVAPVCVRLGVGVHLVVLTGALVVLVDVHASARGADVLGDHHAHAVAAHVAPARLRERLQHGVDTVPVDPVHRHPVVAHADESGLTERGHGTVGGHQSELRVFESANSHGAAHVVQVVVHLHRQLEREELHVVLLHGNHLFGQIRRIRCSEHLLVSREIPDETHRVHVVDSVVERGV